MGTRSLKERVAPDRRPTTPTTLPCTTSPKRHPEKLEQQPRTNRGPNGAELRFALFLGTRRRTGRRRAPRRLAQSPKAAAETGFVDCSTFAAHYARAHLDANHSNILQDRSYKSTTLSHDYSNHFRIGVFDELRAILQAQERPQYAKSCRS